MPETPDMSGMSDPGDAVTETFAFMCGNCGESWEQTFEVVFLPDPAALNPQEYVDEDGKAMRSPLADAVCRVCGSRRVRVMAPDLAERAKAAEDAEHPHHSHHLHLPHRSHPARRTDSED
ncbi:hypothetical protein [Streptomyces sp. NBC_00203]|uniref:hypothetical protein n=1 Tax=Streptomyces sp. NBC_00203 TaxID=2975680 RepID=UPI003254487D